MIVSLRCWGLILALVALGGCGPETPEDAEPPAPPTTLGTAFEPAACGTLTGRVTWAGPVLSQEQFMHPILKPGGAFDLIVSNNPHIPRVAKAGQGLANAVVYLRGLDPARSRPWDLPAVRVELQDFTIRVRQGEAAPRPAGFVRRGQAITMQSQQAVFHNLRGRGTDYFSLAFPDTGNALTRTLDTPGLLHLTSGAGYYWASAYLFVDDLPYYTVTDEQGRFTLDRVPAGPVEVVAWHPNPKYSQQERDPETSAVTRQIYGPPLQRTARVVVTPGKSATVDFTLSEAP